MHGAHTSFNGNGKVTVWHTPCFDTPFSGWNIGAFWLLDLLILWPWVSLEDMLSWSYTCFQRHFWESGLIVGYLISVLLISCGVFPKVQFNFFFVRPIKKKQKKTYWYSTIPKWSHGIMLENFSVAHKFQLWANVIRQSLWDIVWWYWVHATIPSKNKTKYV